MAKNQSITDMIERQRAKRGMSTKLDRDTEKAREARAHQSAIEANIRRQERKEKAPSVIVTILVGFAVFALVANFIRYFNGGDPIKFKNLLLIIQNTFQDAIITIPSIPVWTQDLSGFMGAIQSIVNMLSGVINILVFLANGIIQVLQIIIVLLKNVLGF